LRIFSLGIHIALTQVTDFSQLEHDMQSAQQKEIDEPLVVTTDRTRSDLHSLLRDIRATGNGNLNTLHSRGRVLFAEGEPARGVYILRTGRATVSISSSEGRVVMLRMAQAGDVLGLNSVLLNCSYDTTVKTLEPCSTEFIPRSELMVAMEQSEAGARAILKILSNELTEVMDRTRSLLLPQTVGAKLATLLFKWCKEHNHDKAGKGRIDRVFTHEEIAQMICSSRETVTRLLASMSKRNIIQITSDSIWIRDCVALEKMALGLE
jgi:CRP/FNR family cyclic AMP-dependent transcriptional regulator